MPRWSVRVSVEIIMGHRMQHCPSLIEMQKLARPVEVAAGRMCLSVDSLWLIRMQRIGLLHVHSVLRTRA
jgi:hypothetical protein